MATEEKQEVCSFCGLPSSEHRRLIQGDNCFICDVCIGVCYQMLNMGGINSDSVEDIDDIEEAKAEFKLITKHPIIASDNELENNNRSHSAKLRIIEKI